MEHDAIWNQQNVYVPDYDKGNLGESGTDLFDSVRCSNYEIKTKIHSTKYGTLFIIDYYNVMKWLWFKPDYYYNLKMKDTEDVAMFLKLIER